MIKIVKIFLMSILLCVLGVICFLYYTGSKYFYEYHSSYHFYEYPARMNKITGRLEIFDDHTGVMRPSDWIKDKNSDIKMEYKMKDGRKWKVIK